MKNSSLVLSVFFCSIGLGAGAQKLPSAQKESVAAPQNLKIDGDASEWELKAYSRATEFSFTVANDHDNLYVVIQDTSHFSIQRIASGGVSFIFGDAGKKTEVKPVQVSYPKIQSQFAGNISYQLRTKPMLDAASVVALNKQMNDHLRDMPVNGIPDIQGNTISVYNDLGIVAAQHVNEKKVYAVEFKIPLKYLKTVIDADGHLNYRLQVNGMDNSDGRTVVMGHAVGAVVNPEADEAAKARIMADTYVDGAYTLAKF